MIQRIANESERVHPGGAFFRPQALGQPSARYSGRRVLILQLARLRSIDALSGHGPKRSNFDPATS